MKPLQIEKASFDIFMKKFKSGKCGTQRLGRAFYNHYNLHRLSKQEPLNKIYEKDGDHAFRSIQQIVEFN